MQVAVEKRRKKKEKKKEKILTETQSVCPECFLDEKPRLLPAKIIERDGKVWIRRTCPEHGEIEELYWGSSRMYKKARKFAHDGPGIFNPKLEVENPLCPLSCGYCRIHQSGPALGNLVVTNRCDLNCWYCFFFAEKAGYVYEPTLNQIREMVRNFTRVRPVPGKALQITGGEPAMRDDIVDIIKLVREEGVTHIQFNTDGIKLATDSKMPSRLRKAGINTVYLSFDGTNPKTNPKNHWEAPYAVQNCRRAGLGVVFVPTVIRSINDHDLGNIVRVALDNIDIVRGVNFQPVSLTGRITHRERGKLRITAPDVIKMIEEQTDGQIAEEDWYTCPVTTGLSHLVKALTGRSQFELTNHFACGLATYVFKDNGKLIPITRFVDVDGFVEYANEKAYEISSGKNKIITSLKILFNLRRFIDNKRKPKYLKLWRLLIDVLLRHDYRALGSFHTKCVLLGIMHFMDLYNYDVERVRRCNIVYLSPDGRIIPFCAYNTLSMLYRDKIQVKYGLTVDEYTKARGADLKADLYRRDLKTLKSGDAYQRFYRGVS
ncbi:MAG: tetraether lipid synthase Tes [Candidatus Hodarchaeota archaeon]